MKRHIVFSGAAYLVVGVLSILLAVLLTTTVIKKTRAQDEGVPPPPPVDAPPIEQPVAGTSTIENLSQSVNFLEPYIFDTREGRRNPFRPPIVVKEGPAVNPGTPLELYEVDQIRLVGIMWDTRIPKAMFIDPTGAVHVIGKEDRIGRRQGYVATIRESEVVIVETTNFNGELAYATKILRIDKK